MTANFTIGWFYATTEDAHEILIDLFNTGIKPGAVIAVSDEDLKILREGVVPFPIHVVDNRKIVKPGFPLAS